MTRFRAETYQNEYLPAGGEEVNAIVTVTAGPGGTKAPDAPAAEIIIVDTSGSMEVPRAKFRAARLAASVAIDTLRDGTAFALIAGDDSVTQAFPGGSRLVAATPETRAAGKRAAEKLRGGGGTAIGLWLQLAGRLFRTVPDHICHAILLTDGQDRDETPAMLDAILDEYKGEFQCDCRGVGTDWEVSELRRIASALLGTVDIIPEASGLADEFRALTQKAMGRHTDDVSLRLWTPQGASIDFVRQVAPSIEDLAGRPSADARTVDYATGAWGEESRDYHLCIRVPPRSIGDEVLAGRVSLVVGDEVVGQSLIRGIWTDDERLSTRIDREVAHYTGQAELADAIQDGLEARKRGDDETATSRLGQAVRLAATAGNDATLHLLEQVVEVEDKATGTVRLRRDVDRADEMALDTRSTKTVRSPRSAP
jgi:hypothetical protein